MDVRQKVQVWIYRQVQNSEGHKSWVFLLLKTLPVRGSYWQPVTGSVDAGETLAQAALREAQEETGLTFMGQPYQVGNSFQFQSRWGRMAEEFGFALEAQGLGLGEEGQQVLLDSHEHEAWQWVGAQEALALLKHSSNAEILKQLLEILQKDGS